MLPYDSVSCLFWKCVGMEETLPCPGSRSGGPVRETRRKRRGSPHGAGRTESLQRLPGAGPRDSLARGQPGRPAPGPGACVSPAPPRPSGSREGRGRQGARTPRAGWTNSTSPRGPAPLNPRLGGADAMARFVTTRTLGLYILFTLNLNSAHSKAQHRKGN